MCMKKEEEKKQKLYQNNSLGDLKLYQKNSLGNLLSEHSQLSSLLMLQRKSKKAWQQCICLSSSHSFLNLLECKSERKTYHCNLHDQEHHLHLMKSSCSVFKMLVMCWYIIFVNIMQVEDIFAKYLAETPESKESNLVSRAPQNVKFCLLMFAVKTSKTYCKSYCESFSVTLTESAV